MGNGRAGEGPGNDGVGQQCIRAVPRGAVMAECACGHDQTQHGQERVLYESDSRREVCLECNGYECPGYPRGKAWHRFKAVEEETK